MDRKEARKVYISVEGENCEVLYFKHLASLINKSEKSTNNLALDIKNMSPSQYAKRHSYLSSETKKNGAILPYYHIQDIEDYHSPELRDRFFRLIDNIAKAKKEYHIKYELGYSNYTFELWMLLHVDDMNLSITNRSGYLKYINRFFQRNYSSLGEYKKEDEFQKILNEFVTLESVKKAVERAEKIRQNNILDKKTQEIYKGYSFYTDNPALSVQNIVQSIFEVCEVKL